MDFLTDAFASLGLPGSLTPERLSIGAVALPIGLAIVQTRRAADLVLLREDTCNETS